MRTAKIFPVVLVLLLAAGCAYDERQPGSYGYSHATAHGAEVLSTPVVNPADRSLEVSLRDQLNRFGDLAPATQTIQISARNGVVTLTGTVPGERERQMVDAFVKNTRGVVSLNDQMQVLYPTGGYNQTVYTAPQAVSVSPTTPPPYGQNLSLQVQAVTDGDRALAQRIADGLRNDPVLPGLVPSVTANVAEGTVLLQGTVQGQEQRRAIVDAVKRIPGVLSVRDDLRIR